MSQPPTIIDYLETLEEPFNDVLSAQKEQLVTWAKECQFARQALESNSYLAETAMKDPDSLKNAIINVAAIGISLNPLDKQAYLVPRGKKVCLDISYQGLTDIATSSGAVDWVQAKIVHNDDEYTNTGPNTAPNHTYNPFKDRGAIVGVYCVAQTSSGAFLTEEMSIEEVYMIRGLSAAWKSKKNTSPWSTFPKQMIRKTVIKRAANYWPGRTERINAAIGALNDAEEYDLLSGPAVGPVGTESESLNKLIEATVEEPAEEYDTQSFVQQIKDSEDLKALLEVGMRINKSPLKGDYYLQSQYFSRKGELIDG